jgi:hypothetical protein
MQPPQLWEPFQSQPVQCSPQRESISVIAFLFSIVHAVFLALQPILQLLLVKQIIQLIATYYQEAFDNSRMSFTEKGITRTGRSRTQMRIMSANRMIQAREPPEVEIWFVEFFLSAVYTEHSLSRRPYTMITSEDISSRFWNLTQKPAEELNREQVFIDDIIAKAHVEREIFSHLKGMKTVFEGGAGYGRFSIPLAKRGLEVTHFDISLPMIETAKQLAAEA